MISLGNAEEVTCGYKTFVAQVRLGVVESSAHNIPLVMAPMSYFSNTHLVRRVSRIEGGQSTNRSRARAFGGVAKVNFSGSAKVTFIRV